MHSENNINNSSFLFSVSVKNETHLWELERKLKSLKNRINILKTKRSKLHFFSFNLIYFILFFKCNNNSKNK